MADYWVVVNSSGAGTVVGPTPTAPLDATGLPYPTKAQAQAYASSMTTVPQDVSAAGSSVVNDALKPLFQSHIWLRVAEVVVGLVLLGIGLNALMKGKPLSAVTGAAGVVGKVVP